MTKFLILFKKKSNNSIIKFPLLSRTQEKQHGEQVKYCLSGNLISKM